MSHPAGLSRSQAPPTTRLTNLRRRFRFKPRPQAQNATDGQLICVFSPNYYCLHLRSAALTRPNTPSRRSGAFVPTSALSEDDNRGLLIYKTSKIRAKPREFGRGLPTFYTFSLGTLSYSIRLTSLRLLMIATVTLNNCLLLIGTPWLAKFDVSATDKHGPKMK